MFQNSTISRVFRRCSLLFLRSRSLRKRLQNKSGNTYYVCWMAQTFTKYFVTFTRYFVDVSNVKLSRNFSKIHGLQRHRLRSDVQKIPKCPWNFLLVMSISGTNSDAYWYWPGILIRSPGTGSSRTAGARAGESRATTDCIAVTGPVASTLSQALLLSSRLLRSQDSDYI